MVDKEKMWKVISKADESNRIKENKKVWIGAFHGKIRGFPRMWSAWVPRLKTKEKTKPGKRGRVKEQQTREYVGVR